MNRDDKSYIKLYANQIKSGFGIQVDVRVWNDQEAFYENLGFKISEPQQRGVPMHICLTNQIELADSMFRQCEFGEDKR